MNKLIKNIFLPLVLLTIASPAFAMEAKRDNFEEKQEEVKESWKYNPKELSPFDYLPDELLLEVILHTDLRDCASMARTNSKFAEIIRHDVLNFTPEEKEQIKTYFNELKNIESLASLGERKSNFYNLFGQFTEMITYENRNRTFISIIANELIKFAPKLNCTLTISLFPKYNKKPNPSFIEKFIEENKLVDGYVKYQMKNNDDPTKFNIFKTTHVLEKK